MFQGFSFETPLFAGLADPLLSKMARCGESKLDSYVCRNLHRTIKKIAVDISVVPTKLRLSKQEQATKPESIDQFNLLLS